MDRKVKLAASATLILVVLTVGTGLTLVSAYKLPEANYLALGMLLQNQNGGANQSITGLDSETIAKIENQALTREEIPEIKDKIQNSLNHGFQKWIKQHSIKFTLFNATSETVTPLFFRFLDENPRYKEAFKLYDQVLAQWNTLKMQELTKAIVAMDVDYVVQNGELLNQWNTTSEVNGTTYTSMFKEYSLEVNGTTLTVVKVTIISSDGTVIVDPYLYVHKVDLFYLQFVVISWLPFYGIWVPCYYGWDIYSYIRYPNDPEWNEAVLFLEKAYWDLIVEPQLQLWDLSTYLTGFYALCLIPGLGEAAAAAVTVVEIILQAAGVVAKALGQTIYNEYEYALTYNEARNPSYGICTMSRYHIIYTTNPIEQWSWTNFHVAYCDGGLKQIAPFPIGSYLMSWENALIIVNLFNAINSYCGFEHWVWLGPWVPT
ncbi:MAG: hypothetical protein Q6352_015455 [Candidatus Freyrarchaeum guaymaensis]